MESEFDTALATCRATYKEAQLLADRYAHEKLNGETEKDTYKNLLSALDKLQEEAFQALDLAKTPEQQVAARQFILTGNGVVPRKKKELSVA
jgi:hypothetical protein